MNFRQYDAKEVESIAALFEQVFTASATEAEGALIGKLASDLFASTPRCDLFNFVASENDQIVGSIFFSRLRFACDQNVFVLGPVAVHTQRQGQGFGQRLITHGLAELKNRDVQTVLTYGDPAFYEKVGFRHISDETIQAPFKLSQPHGWLGQSLDSNSLDSLTGRCKCVTAFDDPTFW